jgi:hypothetical protein
MLALGAALLPSTVAADPPRTVDPTAGLVAQGFVVALLGGDLPTAEGLAATPFSFDGRLAPDPGALHAALEELVGGSRLRGRRFLRIESMPAEEAVSRFGPPPARVRDLCAPRAVVALVRLSRGGVVLFVRRIDSFWRVVGVTD